MGSDLIPISVWWDINSCPVPTEYQKDMVECWLKIQPMCLMLISGHEQLEIFAPTLFKIKPLISSLLLAHPGRKQGSEWLWKSFLRGVKRGLIWENFLEGVTVRFSASAPPFRFPPREHVATTTVLWDTNSCPLPGRIDPRLAGPSMKSALKNSGYTGPITITAVGNLERTLRPELLEPLFSYGISLANISSRYCSSQLYDWRMSAQPPATLMLICGPTTLEILFESIFRICDEGYTILVAHPGRKRGSEWIWKSFLSVFLESGSGKSFLAIIISKAVSEPVSFFSGSSEEALEDKSSATGVVTCDMCEFMGFSFKDLTTHFSSDEHLEDGNESESETEHVVEEEEHQMCAKRRA
ncbi:hypothetical protein Bca4012_024206 [Brassica carinata]